MFILSIKAWEDEVSFLTFLAVHFSPTDQYLSDASSETLMWLILVLHLQKNIPATYICTFSNKLWSRFSSISCIHMRMNVYYCEYNSITYAGTARFPSPNICQPLLGYVKFYIYCRGGPFHSRVSHAMQSKYYSYSFCWLQHTIMTELEVSEENFLTAETPWVSWRQWRGQVTRSCLALNISKLN